MNTVSEKSTPLFVEVRETEPSPIDPEVLESFSEKAVDNWPNEIEGWILKIIETDQDVLVITPAKGLPDRVESYLVQDPDACFSLFSKATQGQKAKILAHIHSHPDGNPVPSGHDRASRLRYEKLFNQVYPDSTDSILAKPSLMEVICSRNRTTGLTGPTSVEGGFTFFDETREFRSKDQYSDNPINLIVLTLRYYIKHIFSSLGLSSNR